MNTAFLHAREEYCDDVLAFPATKTGGALTLLSEELHPFESGAYGPALVTLTASDKSKIGSSGDTIDVNAYISWDEGDSWVKVATYKDLRYAASGTVSAQYWIPFAPRLKLDAVFAAGDSLKSGHGCVVNVEFKEMYPGVPREVYFDDPSTATYGFVGATKSAGDSTLAWSKNSTAIDAGENNCFAGAVVWAHADDRSKITNNFAVHLQYSDDDTTYWHGDTLTVCKFTNGTGIFLGAEESVPGAVSYFAMASGEYSKQARYARLHVTGDTAAALTSGHGVKFFMVGFKG